MQTVVSFILMCSLGATIYTNQIIKRTKAEKWKRNVCDVLLFKKFIRMLYYTSSISKYIFVHCGKSHGLLMSHMIRYFQCFCCKNEIKAEIPILKILWSHSNLTWKWFFFCILVKMIVVIYENLTEKIKIALKVSYVCLSCFLVRKPISCHHLVWASAKWRETWLVVFIVTPIIKVGP